MFLFLRVNNKITQNPNEQARRKKKTKHADQTGGTFQIENQENKTYKQDNYHDAQYPIFQSRYTRKSVKG